MQIYTYSVTVLIVCTLIPEFFLISFSACSVEDSLLPTGTIRTLQEYVHYRSLWIMCDYIYIMLCVSLVLAQLLLIIGMEKTETFARDELSKEGRMCSVLMTYFLNYMVMKAE